MRISFSVINLTIAPHVWKLSGFKCFSHESILASERANMDLIWLTDDLYKERQVLPSHEKLAAEVIALLKEAVSEFETAVGWSDKPKSVRRKRR